ncbi:MAG: Ppx/GppA family phosphatase [Halanaerobiaceae bacterium]
MDWFPGLMKPGVIFVRIAAIDLGSNSFRMIIADCNDGKRKVLVSDIVTTRLGEGVDENAVIAPTALKRSEAALAGFTEKIVNLGVDKVIVAGTSALREVKNSGKVVNLVREKLAVELTILSGEEEAQLIYRGVKSDFPEGEIIIFDVGGGSTEIIEKSSFLSLELGAVRMMERYLNTPESPLKASELIELKKAVREILDLHLSPAVEFETIVGVGGTVTTLVAVKLGLNEYIPERIHGQKLDLKSLNRIIRRLASMSIVRRRNISGLPEDRADIIVPGAVIVGEIMDFYSCRTLTVSDRGLLFGLLDVAAVE